MRISAASSVDRRNRAVSVASYAPMRRARFAASAPRRRRRCAVSTGASSPRSVAVPARSSRRRHLALVALPEGEPVDGRGLDADQDRDGAGPRQGRAGDARRPVVPGAPAARSGAGEPRGAGLHGRAPGEDAHRHGRVRGRVGEPRQDAVEGPRHAVAAGARRSHARRGAGGRRGRAAAGPRVLRRVARLRAQHDGGRGVLLSRLRALAEGLRRVLPVALAPGLHFRFRWSRRPRAGAAVDRG